MPSSILGESGRAGVGALIGLLIVSLVGRYSVGATHELPLMIAPLGAAAVLLFAVPDSPLARPWPVIGGNCLSAFVGVATAKLVADPLLAAPLACGLAISLMIVTKCLHPPGGAVALVAVLGGPTIHAAGFGFVLWPVALSAVLLIAAAWAFRRLDEGMSIAARSLRSDGWLWRFVKRRPQAAEMERAAP